MASGVSSGIRRKVDDLGRVVIPAGIRRTLNIREGDTVEVSVDGERVVLAKPRDACVFCGREDEDLHSYRTRLICTECLRAVAEKDADHRGATATAPPQTTGGPSPRTVTAPPQTYGSSAPGMAGATSADEARAPGAPASSPEPPQRPASWPVGPIDGDALARELAKRRSSDDA